MKFGIQCKIFPDLSIEENLKRIKEAGYNGVEWTWSVLGGPSGPVSTKDMKKIKKIAKEIKKLSKDFSLESISITPGFLPNFAEEPDILRIHFEGIVESGTKFVRCFPPCYVGILKPRNKFEEYYNGKKDFHTISNDFKKHLNVFNKLAGEYKIKILFETHDGYFPASFSGFYLFLKEYPPENLGIVLDPENMVREGIENWRLGIEMLFPYIGYVHFKNMGWFFESEWKKEGKSPPLHMKNWYVKRMGLEDGIVDWGQVIYFLKKYGFDGFLVDEDFSKERPEERFENIKYLKKLIEEDKDPWGKWFNWLEKEGK
ncbi:MAG: sugar phosphate isomerase/epimerase family protein [Candidatus Ratteibacteria bacterium]